MILILEFTGAIVILVPFALVLANRLSSHAVPYLWMNLIGSVVLTYVAWVEHQWGFVLIQVVWAIVAAWGLSPWGRPAATGTEDAATSH